MNYSRIYDQLIAKFRNAKLEGYTESHHINPRCLGGGNELENLIDLPARYHFVSPLLLAKIHGGKLIHAAWMMSNEGHYNSKKYQWLRKLHSKKVSESQKGRKLSPDTKAKIVATRRKNGGYVFSEATRMAMSKARKGKKRPELQGRKMSPEARAKISKRMRGATHPNYGKDFSGANNPFYGRSHTDDTKEKLRTSKLGTKHPYKKRRPLTAEEKSRKSQDYINKGIKPPKMFGNKFNKGKIWVNNVNLNIDALILPGELADYYSNGYQLGRCKIKKKAKAA